MKERVALFFDGANHSEALNRAEVSMDFGSFLHNLKKTYTVVSARYYSGVSDKDQYKGVRDFIGALATKGYTPITKPIREFPDGTIKGNVDMEIAVDMLTMAPRLDRVMLFSGDGDFKYLVDTIQRMGIHVTVCSHKPSAAVELRDQANEFLELKELTKTHNY